MEKQKVWDVWLTVWICKKQIKNNHSFHVSFLDLVEILNIIDSHVSGRTAHRTDLLLCKAALSMFCEFLIRFPFWASEDQHSVFVLIVCDFFSQLLFGRALEICIHFPYLSDGNWVQREQLAVRKPYESGNTSLTKDIWKYLQSCIIRSVA